MLIANGWIWYFVLYYNDIQKKKKINDHVNNVIVIKEFCFICNYGNQYTSWGYTTEKKTISIWYIFLVNIYYMYLYSIWIGVYTINNEFLYVHIPSLYWYLSFIYRMYNKYIIVSNGERIDVAREMIHF